MKNKNFKKLKTHEEIMQEIKKRSEKIDQLSHDLELCKSSSTKMIIIDEQMKIADEISKLHSRDCKVSKKELKKGFKSIIKSFA